MNVPVVSHLKLLVNLYNKMNNRFLVLLVIYLIIYLLSVLYKNKQIFCAILLSLLSWERGLKSKNKPSMVAENGNVKTASYENIHKQYENVTRNMAYAKNLRPKAPNVNNSKILNPKV